MTDRRASGEEDWEQEEEPAPPFEIKDIVFALSRSRAWILGFAVIGLAAGVVAAAAQPNTYTSSAKLLLRLGAHEDFTPEDLAGADYNAAGSRPTIYDEIHMLTDQAIYYRVAQDLGPEALQRPACRRA